MSPVICFGELLLRLRPPAMEVLSRPTTFEAVFGGAEANVAASLAAFGMETEFVTRLPDNPLGDAALRSLRAAGVGTRHVLRGGTRIGIYFLEQGISIRPSRVVYDRAH
ncbi:MAG: PfkB family carbohydrate kinase, partial [Bacteroidota bacterium]|nr:PfkB family carbohydrate kinase [Bacteroidota bacterium]